MTPLPLAELLPEAVGGDPRLAEVVICGVQADSREVKPGDLFVAVRGLRVDGHDYTEQAVRAGAAAIVAERPLDVARDGQSIPCIVVDDSTRTLGMVASRLHGQPSRRLEITGITGTNGKTTTAFLLESMLRHAGKHTGLIGTVVYRYGDHSEPAPYTTPTPVQLQRTLQQVVQADCSHAVMEVSSHGLQLGRLWGCELAVGAFSQLSHDHLDLHGSMQAYLQAKTLLFSRHLRSGGAAVINIDGQGADAMLSAVHRRPDLRLIRCSRNHVAADAHLHDVKCDLLGLRATLELDGKQAPIQTHLIGDYNGDNLLLAAACAHALGLRLDTICAGAEALGGVAGRLERVDDAQPFAVLVDYAHTPDALARTLEALRPLCKGRLWVVFGCGGDRDRGKRPLMGRAAARLADVSVVTSDNPRSEHPQAIIDQITAGMVGEACPRLDLPRNGAVRCARGYWVQPARERAIQEAVGSLEAGDILLIAGKGHENYQIIGDRRRHFDDREQARRALRERVG